MCVKPASHVAYRHRAVYTFERAQQHIRAFYLTLQCLAHVRPTQVLGSVPAALGVQRLTQASSVRTGPAQQGAAA